MDLEGNDVTYNVACIAISRSETQPCLDYIFIKQKKIKLYNPDSFILNTYITYHNPVLIILSHASDPEMSNKYHTQTTKNKLIEEK